MCAQSPKIRTLLLLCKANAAQVKASGKVEVKVYAAKVDTLVSTVSNTLFAQQNLSIEKLWGVENIVDQSV